MVHALYHEFFLGECFITISICSNGTGMIDEIDRKILKELQLDARTSYAELGRRVGLTTPAVIERVRKLEDASIITGYRAEIDTAKVGLADHGICSE